MSAPPLQAAIFDFDGTLADSMETTIELYNRAATWLRVRKVGRDEVQGLREMRPLEAMKAMAVPAWKVPLLVHSVRRSMKRRVRELAPFPGLDAALSALRGRGVRCHVLSSNSRENIALFLDHHRLHHFDQLAGGSSVFGKARHLRAFVRQQGIDPARAIYVGDEVRDVEAAHGAGLRCASVTWGYSDRKALEAARPELLVDSPEALVAALLGEAPSIAPGL